MIILEHKTLAGDPLLDGSMGTMKCLEGFQGWVAGCKKEVVGVQKEDRAMRTDWFGAVLILVVVKGH